MQMTPAYFLRSPSVYAKGAKEASKSHSCFGGCIHMKPFVWMVLSFSLTISAAETTATVKDPGLEANVRMFIHGADPAKPLTQAQLDHVYLVSASNKPIKDLAGLEKCPNLNTMYLSRSDVSDLSPLSKLTNLEQLTISGAKVHDLTPLAGLTHLHYLDLSSNQVQDLAPLANLKRAA
jgi:Leucine-rich repeat (LRR) protein